MNKSKRDSNGLNKRERAILKFIQSKSHFKIYSIKIIIRRLFTNGQRNMWCSAFEFNCNCSRVFKKPWRKRIY